MAKPKFFRVAVEGATATDGRVIERSWIDDIVATYNRATYGARVNLEHVKGYTGEPPFNAYGDVLSVRAQDDELQIGGKTVKRRALYAEIEPTDALVALSKAKQKIYTSIEVAPNFANTNKAGLVGLAATDNPASLGTDILSFSASNDAVKAMFNSKKQAPENFLTEALEVAAFSFDDEAAPDTSGVLSSLATLFRSLGVAAPQTPPAPVNDNKQAAPSANDNGQFAAIQGLMVALAANVDQAIKANGQTTSDLAQRFTALEAKLDSTERRPAGGGRAPASGASTFSNIDC